MAVPTPHWASLGRVPTASLLVADTAAHTSDTRDGKPDPLCGHSEKPNPSILPRWLKSPLHLPLASQLLPSKPKSTALILTLLTGCTVGRLGEPVLPSAFGEGPQIVASSSDTGRTFRIRWLVTNMTDVKCWEAITPLKQSHHNSGRYAGRNRIPRNRVPKEQLSGGPHLVWGC